MADTSPVWTSQLKTPEQAAIKEMVDVYQNAYKNDRCIQLEYTMPGFMERMAETIATRVEKPECEFIVARKQSANQIIGWLALAFKLEKDKILSEEHLLLTQYALLPDTVAKGKIRVIGTDKMRELTHSVLKQFKDARETQLLDKHCIICTLVVDPKHQNKGVASALLSQAISISEVFSFPIWVQAPEACQSLFERYLFKEAGECQLDLNDFVPDLDRQGKANAVSTLGKYIWKFLIRKDPLDQAIQAYRSSQVFAENQAKQGVGESLLGKGKKSALVSEDCITEDETEPAMKDGSFEINEGSLTQKEDGVENTTEGQ